MASILHRLRVIHRVIYLLSPEESKPLILKWVQTINFSEIVFILQLTKNLQL